MLSTPAARGSYYSLLILGSVAAAFLVWGQSCRKGDSKTFPTEEECPNCGLIGADDSETCGDGLDNDGNGLVDCEDEGCSDLIACAELCDNGQDDDNDGLTDCEDNTCAGYAAACGEVCGDAVDNDGDDFVDCADSDCDGIIPPCGDSTDPDGDGNGGDGGPANQVLCAYNGEPEHLCACSDGDDNDGDGDADEDDIHCFGPGDDDEDTFATGIPGDNKGNNASRECPFDGNSGPGNDLAACCNDDASVNVTPNGCDHTGCCELDVNLNDTGEFVVPAGDCGYTDSCDNATKLGCDCTDAGDCGADQFCVADDDSGQGFCSYCEPCVPDSNCLNDCACGEDCFGGFAQPDAECSDCTGTTECNGDGDCAGDEACTSGCCRSVCGGGLTPCETQAECPDSSYLCITGCCVAPEQ